MVLSDVDIEGTISTGLIQIEPFDKSRLQPASIDLTLGNIFTGLHPAWNGEDVDLKKDQAERFIVIEANDSGYPLMPGQFVLGHTAEMVGLSRCYCGRVEGKSSLGRLGLLVHLTAGFIDPGFYGHITLEMVNLLNVPIILYPGMPVAQLCFMRLTSLPSVGYGEGSLGSKYQGQIGPTVSQFHKNFMKGLIRNGD